MFDDVADRRLGGSGAEPIGSVDFPDGIKRNISNRETAAQLDQSIDVPRVQTFFTRPEVVLLSHGIRPTQPTRSVLLRRRFAPWECISPGRLATTGLPGPLRRSGCRPLWWPRAEARLCPGRDPRRWTCRGSLWRLPPPSPLRLRRLRPRAPLRRATGSGTGLQRWAALSRRRTWCEVTRSPALQAAPRSGQAQFVRADQGNGDDHRSGRQQQRKQHDPQRHVIPGVQGKLTRC